ncbi:MAG: alpha/beta fold hydrolase [Bacteroidetes bacterium]|nr:alpha/beta fold hydrolase [Bacteroidota bacterium]
MDSSEFQLKAGKQVLHTIAWLPETPMRAGIALVHGQGEHCGRYDHFAEFFNDQGIGVMGIDHTGHGLTPGARGHVARYEDYLDGVEALVAEWRRREPHLPLFLYGQSMGGNIVANYVLRRNHDLAGAICSSAWFQLAFKPPAFKVHLASFMVRILPSYAESNGLNADDLSRDPVVSRDYRNDPLVHDKISAGAFFGIHQAGQWAMDHADSLRIPVLVMHGSADKLTSAPASKAFAEKAGPLARYVEWPGAYHELHNETNRMEVMRTALEWIDGRIGAKA